MKIRYDSKKDKLTIGGRVFDMEDFRSYMLKYWEPLVVANFVGSVRTDRGTVFTYDWGNIATIAAESTVIAVDFLAKQGVLSLVRSQKCLNDGDGEEDVEVFDI